MAWEDESWNVFRSHKRVAQEKLALSPWMVTALQSLKLSLFLLGSAFLVCGTAFSKAFVFLLATNLRPSHANDAFTQKCGGPDRTGDRLAATYIALFLIQFVPDVIYVVKVFRRTRGARRTGTATLSLILLESVRALGLSLLIFRVVPYLDLPRSVALFFSIPLVTVIQRQMMIMSTAARPANTFTTRVCRSLSSVPHFFCVLLLASAMYLWAILDVDLKAKIALPIGVLCSSIGFWESWIQRQHENTMFHDLFEIKYGIKPLNKTTIALKVFSRNVIILSILIYSTIGHVGIGYFGKVLTSWSLSNKFTLIIIVTIGVCFLNEIIRSCTRLMAALDMKPISLLHPAATSALLLYAFVRSTCDNSTCSTAKNFFHIGLGWHCDSWGDTKPISDLYFYYAWMLIGAYHLWRHVRVPTFDRSQEVIQSIAASTIGYALDQCLIVYQYEVYKKVPSLDVREVNVSEDILAVRNDDVDNSMTVYICATMWHETDTEMTQMMRSILKLDEDHIRRQHKEDESIQFQLEGHIFFDDAWTDEVVDGAIRRVPNSFFETFFHLLNEMTGEKVADNDRLSTRVLVNTPYGGRLVVKLPAGTLLFVHLKDKSLIRNKKRWSQVMYMYYLLGHRIMDSALSLEDRQRMAERTFVLAIDGDSKFEPEALLRLLSLMRQKSDIGCACGRIHPIGSGVMVWYQKFEYAIAHWFQKAAEHVFGCVLCAPGCFSLFRASALMDDNVMHKYTKTAEEPRHFVQYDQGEDRWLSTLMLKQGYRIEYVAASDAETYAPEGFEEFFNQRRRWTPSSIANTVDLLMDYKRAIEKNNSISMAYISYQFLVIAFSMLGPAIIFSMVVYAQVAAFGVDSARMMLWNGVPVLLFILLCFITESNVQLWYAKILSICYAFVMLAVLVATTSQIVLETVLSPTSMFVVAMVLIFFMAACLHPREFSNIVYGTVFFLMIPSTYILLTLYSLINLNVINWGTREAVAKATGQAQSEGTLERVIKQLSAGALAPIFDRLAKAADPSVEQLERKLQQMERKLDIVAAKEGGLEMAGNVGLTRILEEDSLHESELSPHNRSENRCSEREKDELSWMRTGYLKCCERGRLKDTENAFWKQLIKKYLLPVKSSPAEQRRVADGLASLRNNIAFAIILFNALLALAIFLIQKHKNVLSFHWVPYEGFKWTKMNEMTGQFEETEDPLKIDPLGMAIIIFLIGILIVQTIGMVIHRLNTLIGVFQEIGNLREMVSHKKHKRDDRILATAREMLDTWKAGMGHGCDGYTRHSTDTIGDDQVLFKLQRARLADRMRRGAFADD